ncbi:meiotic attachment of telomere to nuclear envelope [Mactra antiquata]
MADKLNDEEIVNELKRFGEAVTVPIARKKRPILIKKLNHHYAKENPPPKRGKGGNRQTKQVPRPAEFSDDSQEEGEFESRTRTYNTSKINSGFNSFNRDSSRKTRNRSYDNGATSSKMTPDSFRSRGSTSKSKNKRNNSRQVEIYPDEFSDNETAEESVYEVEEQSIGINTTLNYEDDDDDDDDDDMAEQVVYAKPSSVSSTPNKRMVDGKSDTKVNDSEHFIPKTLLIVMGIFFVILAVSYVYVKRDFLIPWQAAELQKDDLKNFIDSLNSSLENVITEDHVKEALKVTKALYDALAKLKAQHELGEISEKEVRMTRDGVKNLLDVKMDDTDSVKVLDLCFKLIVRFPEWDILAYAEDGSDALTAEEVYEVESIYGDLPLHMRIILALYRVLYGLLLLLICIFIGVLGIFYLRWQNKKKEKMQQKVYELVEKIIETLKDNFEMSERKNDHKSYPPYLAVSHIRDQLIPVAKRRQMQPLWDEAVKFIESTESRIRVETQIIQGEEFTVWRWLQAIPNGHKMWQGQAFGETSQGSVNSLPYGPTPCLKVRNMFDANMEQSVDDWHLDIEESILEKCQDNNGILHIFVDRSSREGCVYIKCSSCEKAYEAYQALHGWWFDGRLVTVKYLRLEHYHDRFPDSRNKRHPLKPSKREMPSVSRPYHKSALEMT